MVGSRVTFNEDLGHKRCMVIEVEYAGTVVSVDDDEVMVAVDTVDGMAVVPPVCKVKKFEEVRLEEACRA